MKILATYSPCCKWLTEGDAAPSFMHNGLCRDMHGGKLGPTIRLVDAELLHEAQQRLAAAESDKRAILLAVDDIAAERDWLRYLLGQIISDLPANKDWLDPAIEREARAALEGQDDE